MACRLQSGPCRRYGFEDPAYPPSNVAPASIKSLFYGLRSKGNAAEFADLIDAHHYTDGFALVPQGSPTNNTTDASSAFSRKDPTFDISFAVERQDALDAASNSDGNIFASLLGLDPKILSYVQYADGIDQQSSADSVTALWPSTLGYFLSQMMSNVFSVDQIEDARQYVLANASPRGAIPAFRTGQTPYGVLPATSLKRYKPTQSRTAAPSIEAPLVDFIQRLWPIWLQSPPRRHTCKTAETPINSSRASSAWMPVPWPSAAVLFWEMTSFGTI